MKRRSPLVLNSTVPSRFAKIVSSRPSPAPGPGRNLVPRWRTRIMPALTGCPAKIFTPSIFGFESRPFREEPSPFLCAIRGRLLLRGRLPGGRLARRLLRRRLGRLFALGLGCLARRLLPDRLDLHLREAAAVADVPLVALLRLVLP